jgi:ferredoxin--NADP+ reductase
VLDLSGLEYRFLEGQSLGVLAPGVDERGRPHKLRLYSIASTRTGDDGRGTTASLCVKRVIYKDPVTGVERRGIASNYLCDLAPGDQVMVTGPAGKSFLLPDDPGSNLILVATGTGIAPFRAFLRRIFRDLPRWTGAVHLFFGARTEAECLYREELESYLDRPGYRRSFAFSREQTTPDGRRMYVQDRMAERLDELGELLGRENTYLYICGLKGMEAGIEALFEGEPRGGISSTSFQALRKSGRILVETY